MGQAPSLTGPDLTQGVPEGSVADDAIVLGHALGEPVLLAKVDGALCAVGATCTHYSGPLGEGLRTGAHVRCPWHHACFDLRTGIPVRAPALRALPRYAVEVVDGIVRVTGRAPDAPRAEGRPGPASVVVIGGGAAGAAGIEALRNAGYDGPVTLIGREPTMPLDRPNVSKDYLAGTAPEEWMTLRDEAFYADAHVVVRTGIEATAIDPGARRITLSDGATLEYGACLLATGADPIRLPIPGADQPHVFTVRTLADSRAIIAKTTSSKRAVVVGASFIGLEVAASLRARGLEVDVVAPEKLPLEQGARARARNGGPGRPRKERRAIPPRAHAHGDRVRGGRALGRHAAPGRSRGPRRRRPPSARSRRARGLEIDRGVVVDAFLQTSAPGVWAAGDIARWPDPHTGERQRIEHWVLAERQGQVAARNIVGASEPFEAIPFFWSVHFDMVVNVVGFLAKWDRVEVRGDLDARDASVAFWNGGRIVGVATVGRDRDCLVAEDCLERDDQAGLAALFRGGSSTATP